MAKKEVKQQDPTFEEAISQLEELVEIMESGELSLDDSLQAFEKGVKLTRICQKSLEEAEQKVRILSENKLDSELEPFDSEQ